MSKFEQWWKKEEDLMRKQGANDEVVLHAMRNIAEMAWDAALEAEGDGRVDELRANARLIAAAPDLLEALEECRFALEPYDDAKPRDWSTDREKLRRAHEAARAAIAKATGG